MDYNYSSTGTNKKHISVKNTSTGYTVDIVVLNATFQSDMQNSEWINERPSCNSGLTDMADFSFLGWTSPQARPNMSGAGLAHITSFANTYVMMQDQNMGITLAKLDGLDANANFKDRWYAAGTDGTC